MSDNITDAELHLRQKTEAARDEVQQYVNQFASANATEDLMRSIQVEVVEFQGQDRTIIRDGNTNAILSQEQMLEKFKQERPSYLYSDQQKEKLNNVDNDINAAYQKEKDELQAQVAAAASSGNFELFKTLRKQQGATYR